MSFRGTPNYERLTALATGIAKSVRDSGGEPLVLIIDGDIGGPGLAAGPIDQRATSND